MLVESWLSSEILEEVSDSHTSLKKVVGRKAVQAVVRSLTRSNWKLSQWQAGRQEVVRSLTRSNWKVNAVAVAVAVAVVVARREEVIRSLIRSN